MDFVLSAVQGRRGLAVWRSAARTRALEAVQLQMVTAQRRRARASDAVRRWRYGIATRALAAAQPPIVLRLVVAGVGARPTQRG